MVTTFVTPHKNADVVFVLDTTLSMGPVLETIKMKARGFRNDLAKLYEDRGVELSSCRVRIILFKDYMVDEVPMLCSDFFSLPEEEEAFLSFLDQAVPDGGGDQPENGLEALYYASQSDFGTDNDTRQFIFLFTDSEALDLRERSACLTYPEDMVDSDGLSAIFAGEAEGLKFRPQRARLLFFAPEGSRYDELLRDYPGYADLMPSKMEGRKSIPLDYAELLTRLSYLL